ncbi:hypothetical protein SVIO_050590 [Streptomyces violaceusniger]|uniref:VWA containing CoxE family protein n=1 Tax=Streptomyces violaceusniger TaxID=68280 RepID=A0A4D4L5I3_STRVO|nr:hypothetical protein SVIO_050590 [Streptomyces violaceusniger]
MTHGAPHIDADPHGDPAPNDARAQGSHPQTDQERLRRWRLVLGGQGADGTGCSLSGTDAAMDRTLEALYGSGGGDGAGGSGTAAGRSGGSQGAGSGARSGGLGGSAPQVARWLGDIRTYFPTSVVQVMQRDAIDRLGLSALLLEPEMLEAVEADVHLVGTLLSLNKAMPETTKNTARAVVRKVVEDLEKRLATRTRATLTGALDRSARISRPRHRDIDWDRTIRANLKNYLPDHRTVVPSGSSDTAGRPVGSRRTWCCASTSRGRWPRPWSTPRSSAPCSPRCAPSPPGWSSSTPPWST